MPTLSILIPAYNEESTITTLLERIKNLTLKTVDSIEVIIVDRLLQRHTILARLRFCTEIIVYKSVGEALIWK